MSHSPDKLPEDAKFTDLEPAYVQSVVKLNQMLDRGVSWSGHEANCCFLNTGTGSFANVSAITGLDFLDDGRGLALVDWDRDGDLDAWTSNRTAPMCRFVRNDTPQGKHFLMVRLEGVDCNRDAIGARVQVTPSSDSRTTLTRTLRAGEGFLGQSSKWLHFGLGDQADAVRLTVQWPDGSSQDFQNLAVDQRYKIRQGDEQAKSQTAKPANYDLATSPRRELPKHDAQSRALLSSRLPIPPLKLQKYAGGELDATEGQPNAVLLNIWASWCRPCLAELRELSEREDELRAAGLEVYAANVDGLGDARGMTQEKHQALLERLGYPFEAGTASASLASNMESVVNFVYGPNRPLPVPTSFLIDSSGRLAAIYKGQLDLDQLAEDLKTLSLDDRELQEAALPFPGRWIGQTPQFRPIGLAVEMAEQGIDDDLLLFLRRQASALARDNGYGQFASEVARKLMLEERYDQALAHLQVSTEIAPPNAGMWAQLGEVQLQLKQTTAAEQSFRRALAIDKNQVVANFQLGNLLSRQRKPESAEKFYEQAISGKSDLADAHYQLAAVKFQLRKTAEAVHHMERYVEQRPADFSARTNLGGMLAALGRFAEAEVQLRISVDEDPGNSMARNNLGRVLQDQGKHLDAIEQFKIAMRSTQSTLSAGMNLVKLLATSSDEQARNVTNAVKVAEGLVKASNEQRADVLAVLATALQSAQRYEEALQACEKALSVAKLQGNTRLVTRINQQLQQLKNNTGNSN